MPDVDFVLVMSVNPGFGGQTSSQHAAEAAAREGRPDRSRIIGVDRDRRRHELANVAEVVAAGQTFWSRARPSSGTSDPETAT